MNVAVCVKQIPDPAMNLTLDPGTHTIVREGKLILDDSDAYGVEMGLQLVEAAGGGDVVLLSMAPNSETSGLRTALAMGAASAVLVSDPALAGSDALGTAKVLAGAVKRVQPDLVLAATESTDGYTGTVPATTEEAAYPLHFVAQGRETSPIAAADRLMRAKWRSRSGVTPSKARAPSNTAEASHIALLRGPMSSGLPSCQSPSKNVQVLDQGLAGIRHLHLQPSP